MVASCAASSKTKMVHPLTPSIPPPISPPTPSTLPLIAFSPFVAKTAFRNQLAKEFALENLRFYREVVAFQKKFTFKTSPNLENTSLETQKEAKLIHLKYIAENCPYLFAFFCYFRARFRSEMLSF